ncbi:phospholipase D family protein [Kineosporia babensis]|uniref:Phospholipase D-like domain-containing protein n=1 Tax=Kineosporia babensis TaxID=499548 RepID=A0A9X1NEM2_9ACTN|nr:phospholipase D family protein [Kineosporia babensis]MCD5311673.1 phospholipase D-like domain-containing protein [Kineosporia babensis]
MTRTGDGAGERDLDGLPNVDEEGEAAPDIDPEPDIDVAGVDEAEDPATRTWFLTPSERGNPSSSIDRVPRDDGRGWVAGNQVRPVVHGAQYFRRLHEELDALKSGDRLYFTDWRGDRDEKLLEDGPTIGEMLTGLAKNGVEVRGLLWRSHSDSFAFSAQENQRLGTEINLAGGEVLLDQRVRRFGAHHQKLFVIRHRGEPDRDVAFVGGIDLCYSRRDDAEHHGDPQQAPMDQRYQGRAPWHDAALELRGPIVGDLLRTFIERWDDPTPLDRRTPYRMLIQRRAHMPRRPKKLPESFPDPQPSGRHAVQILRTYGAKRPRYPFAADGERSVARAYEKAFRQARSLIYFEDQYLWSKVVAAGIAEALRREPELRVIAVVPRYPDQNTPPNRLGQLDAIRTLKEAAPERFAVYDLENAEGVPIYVHAKVCVVDDVWMTCGSDNFNRRSWTNDSELTCAVLDPEHDPREPRQLGARKLPRELRLQLWAEHLGLGTDDPRLLDPASAFDLWAERAQAMDDWHAGGRTGERPGGHARVHRPEPIGRLTRLWATPVYRTVYDPDDRPRRLRSKIQF